jgi:antagonist of KipI
MSLRIIKGGILDTVQDRGRFGYQYLGINPGGAMDTLSAQVANVLVGNDPAKAVVELHFPASEFFFEQPALIAISGADFTASINGDEIPCLQPIAVSKYSILQFYRRKSGARAYLAVHGGLDVPKWFNSYSTHLKAMAGGLNGKTLQKDDEIRIQTMTSLDPLLGKKEFHVLPWKADKDWGDSAVEEILVLPGHEWEHMTEASKEIILQTSYMITSQSDRMGYSLSGQALTMQKQEEMVSSGVCFGTVQLLPDGQLIILMADHQTTGGYPRVAHVISAHHSRLAQMNPGQRVQFGLTDLKTAEDLLVKQQQHLVQLENACKFKLEELMRK